jgi:serine/threonine protein phosphatase 1
VFGDVHGESSKLESLVSLIRARFGTDVDIYSLGDLVDRGPDSKGVLDVCVREGIQGIRGNHELWLIGVAAGLPGAMHDGVYSKIMGGIATLRSYGLERGDPDNVGPALYQALPEAHREFLLNLPPYRHIRVGGRSYWLVHAGLTADTMAGIMQSVQGPPLTEEMLIHFTARGAGDLFFWISPKVREPRSMFRFPSGAMQILGHVPVGSQPIVQEHYIALDTGCGTCPPHTLSAVVLLPDGGREFLQVR